MEDWAEVTFVLRELQRTGNESTLHHGENVGETMFSRFLWLPHLRHTRLAVLSVSLMTSDILYLRRGREWRMPCSELKLYSWAIVL